MSTSATETTTATAPVIMRGKTKRVNALLEQAIKVINTPDAALSIIRDAQRLLQGGVGAQRPRSDKPPSAYNLFVKKTMQDLKAENPQLSNKERMTMCAALWRKQKEETAPVAAADAE